MSANLMLREIGIALFLAAVGIGAGDGFIDAIVDGGYRWIGYGVAITVLPLIIVALVARLWLKMNYYTLMGLAGRGLFDGLSRSDVPARADGADIHPLLAVSGTVRKKCYELLPVPHVAQKQFGARNEAAERVGWQIKFNDGF